MDVEALRAESRCGPKPELLSIPLHKEILSEMSGSFGEGPRDEDLGKKVRSHLPFLLAL